MAAQCIPSRVQNLTGWGVVAAGTIALMATAPPAAPLAAVAAIAAAAVTLTPRKTKTRNVTDWITEIRSQPVTMRGTGAAEIAILPLRKVIEQEVRR